MTWPALPAAAGRRRTGCFAALAASCKLFEGAGADAPRREIHHAQEGRIVVGIGDQAQVGERMLDLLPLEKAQAAIDAVGNAGGEQRVLQHPRLRIGAVEQRDLARAMPLADERLDFLDDPARLVAVGVRLEDAHRLARAGLGPQVLAEARGLFLMIALAASRMLPCER